MNFSYQLVDPHLAHLDDATGDALVVYFFEDERPLKGLAGLIDWRLNGKLTSFLLEKRMDGHFRECTLYPVRSRLNFKMLLLIGLGEKRTFNGGKFQIITSFTLDTLRKIGVTHFALSIPPRPHLKISIRQVMEIWLTECRLRILGLQPGDLSVSFYLESEQHPDATDFIEDYIRQYVHKPKTRFQV